MVQQATHGSRAGGIDNSRMLLVRVPLSSSMDPSRTILFRVVEVPRRGLFTSLSQLFQSNQGCTE
jgi:hypothetical protein